MNFTYILALLNYKIHGLWIDYTNGSYPMFCRIESYNETEVAPIVPLMREYFFKPSLFKHEWEKHGTCFENYTQLDYFNKTINIYTSIEDKMYTLCEGYKWNCLINVDDYFNQVHHPHIHPY
jgi:ribonuclease I